MEGAGHRGRWNKKAPVGTVLMFLMYMFIPTVTLETSAEPTCPHGDYSAGKGICCNKCSPGFKLVEKCNATGHRSNCAPCPAGQYTDQMNFFPNCRRCRRCKESKHEVEVSQCEPSQNTICRCETGYYKFNIDPETYECRRCLTCRPDEKQKQPCTPEKNTVCECQENYYRDKGKCTLCKNCSNECKHLCPPSDSQNTRAPGPGNEYLINIIAGVVVVAVVLLVLVVVITYVATKQSSHQELQKPSTQPSDVSLDLSKVLILNEDPSDNMCVTAVPQNPLSEQEPSNLPDCVPLEVNISDLIYKVLDLVPVLQRKQLVRSLGVNDTEIEQAEMDHRSCREAHYQMLKVWTMKGSPAGGGEGGRMLHWPLLQELLDKLREMHLGQAAEELETKYGIQ